MSKRILITGGSGFLGQRLATMLGSDWQPVLGARNHRANARAGDATDCPTIPLDISSIESVRDVVREVRPKVIIHAAATKYVALAEALPMECVDINVRGSQNVARVAIDQHVEAVIGVSSDKAAAPQGGTYALSKAMMERMFCAMDAKAQTRFACVRLGNIAWSTGSVFPEWLAMTTETGVVTSTGPDMSRFFITVDRAASVVLLALGNLPIVHGGVLAQPMCAATIRDLLGAWIEIHGGRWVTGERRRGDRDVEWLIGDAEAARTRTVLIDEMPYYLITPGDLAESPLQQGVVSSNAERLSRDAMLDLVRARRDC